MKEEILIGVEKVGGGLYVCVGVCWSVPMNKVAIYTKNIKIGELLMPL